MNCMEKSALYLWCAGLAIITFDRLFFFQLGGFTVKSYYFLFIASALLFLYSARREKILAQLFRELRSPPWIFIFLLFVYELARAGFSPLPVKSYAYSIWLLFDIAVVGIPGSLLLRRAPDRFRTIGFALSCAAIFLVTVLIIDTVAFSYGYIGGLIGNNQELSLKWGMSRAHAFSYEPSYLSLYFSLSLLFLTAEALRAPFAIPQWLLLLALALLAIGIFLLGSRTGWLLTGVGLAFLLFTQRARLRNRKVFWAVASLPLGLLLIVFLLPLKHRQLMYNNLVGTIIAGTDGSANTRVESMRDAIRICFENKGLGIGVGASLIDLLQKHPEKLPTQFTFTMGGEYIMSIWGQIVAESGFPGLLFFTLFCLSFWWVLFRQAKADRSPRSAAYFISSVLLFGIAAHLVGNVARTDIWVWAAVWMANVKA